LQELPEEVHVFRCLPAENQDNVGLMLSKVPFTQLIQLPHVVKVTENLHLSTLFYIYKPKTCFHKHRVSSSKPLGAH